MDYNERIQSKVEMVFQIVNEFLLERITLSDAKKQIDGEMTNIRPAQYEAVKVELGKRLKDSSSSLKAEKLFDLFKNYISPPYDKLENGHPLRIYYEENNKVRDHLILVDKMEGEESTLDEWKNIYALIKKMEVHIKRPGKKFYPLMTSVGLRLQVEKVKQSGVEVIQQIHKNEELLEAGEIVEFLVNQRSLTQAVTGYLDFEERVLFPKALSQLKNHDFQELRKADDAFGYVFIDQPGEFIIKQEKAGFDPGMILSSLLVAKNMSIIYYTLSGQVISAIGNGIEAIDLVISEKVKEELLDGTAMQKKQLHHDNGVYLITHSLVTDEVGNPKGILKIKEDTSGMEAIAGKNPEDENRMARAPLQGGSRIENRTIDSSQSIAELFAMYPDFKVDFYGLDEELKGLKGQLGMEILKDATVGMLAKSLRVESDGLVNKINRLLVSY